MENFVSWEVLSSIGSLITIVFGVVEFTKELPAIRLIPTKYWSFIIAFLLIIAFNIHNETFVNWDLLIYALSAMSISLSANGLSNFNKKEIKLNEKQGE